MKTTEAVPNRAPSAIRNKRAGKVKRQFSAQALARMGRPAKYPEAAIVSERFGVSYSHAYMVCRGTRSSPIAEHLPAIRAELAAKKATP